MRLHHFTRSEFSALKNQWQNLLSRSDADSLFLSWHWMHSWWEIYGDLKGDELLLLGIFNNNDELICLAPFYSCVKKIKGIVPVKIVQFIGTRTNGSSGFRSEYLQFIVDKNESANVINKVFDYLLEISNFDELWLNDLVVDSPTYQELNNPNADNTFYKRLQSKDCSYGINVDIEFADYVKNLGKNTRLKTFNRRKVLEKLGDVHVDIIDNDTVDICFNALTEFHEFRWGEKISYIKHSDFIKRLTFESDIAISGVLVKLDSEILGSTLDIICNKRTYNIQSGYKENVDKKIAMGSLTIGYAIEHYCQLGSCHYYDFLAGEGKNSNYKERIATPEIECESIQFISSLMLRYLYKFKDKMF